MKTMLRIAFFSVIIASLFAFGPVLFSQFVVATPEVGPAYTGVVENNDSLLHEVQDKIYQSFVQSMMQQDAAPLLAIEQGLEQAYSSSPQNLIQYWLAYQDYYHCIYLLQAEEEKAAESAVKAAIKRLEKLDNKNAEDYALLAMAQSLSIRFVSPMKAPFISAKVNKYAEAALAKEPENVRAHFVLGSSDYYTPEKYGGGTKVEGHLQKAIEYPAQAVPSPYLPSWGQSDAYEMLIRFYIKKERWEDAKDLFQEASDVYPGNYMIQQLATQLVGK